VERVSPSEKKLNIVLIASQQDHGPGQHDYPAWQKKWHSLLGHAPGVTVTDAWLWPTTEQFEQSDLLVFYFWNHDWNAERYQHLDAYLEQGRGIVLLHSATIADKDPGQLAARIGLAAQPGPTKYLHCPLDLKIVAAPDHPITRSVRPFSILDEWYYNIRFRPDMKGVTPILVAKPSDVSRQVDNFARARNNQWNRRNAYASGGFRCFKLRYNLLGGCKTSGFLLYAKIRFLQRAIGDELILIQFLFVVI
jgi:hypothetical protein